MKKFLLIILLCGCGYTVKMSEHSFKWKSEPISYLFYFSNEKELGYKPRFFTRLLGFITGRKIREKLYLPYAVSVKENVIAVSDMYSKSVIIFLRDKGALKRLTHFSSPVGLAVCRDKLYISDSEADSVLAYSLKNFKKVKVFSLKHPTGIACFSDRVCISETYKHRIVCFNGEKKIEIGKRGVNDGEFNFPTHLTFDRRGRLFVVDSLNYRIQIFSPQLKFQKKLGKQGDLPGYLSSPKGIGVDSDGNIYIADALMDAVQVFDEEGNFLYIFGGTGTAEGRFYFPTGISIDEKDRIFVADTYNGRVQVFAYIKDRNG